MKRIKVNIRNFAYWVLWMGPILLVKVFVAFILLYVCAATVWGFLVGTEALSTRFHFLELGVIALFTLTGFIPNDDVDFGSPAFGRMLHGALAKIGLKYHWIIGAGWSIAAIAFAFTGTQGQVYTSLLLVVLIFIHDIEGVLIKGFRRLRPPTMLASL